MTAIFAASNMGLSGEQDETLVRTGWQEAMFAGVQEMA
jgi:hypothetical protein